MSRGATDEAVAEARTDLKTARLADSIRTALETAPPLSARQRAELVELLSPPPPAGVA